MIFKDRRDAGKKLAVLVKKFAGQKDIIVLGLPRGGVICADEVAKALQAPLDVICPRKIGAPFNPELALGAVTESGIGFFNDDLIHELGIPRKYLEEEIEKKKKESAFKQSLFRKNKPPLNVEGKTVILVDDGLATGATMKAAITWAKSHNAKHIVACVPVSPQESLSEIKALADEVFCLYAPSLFYAVGQFYEDFGETQDTEVLSVLK